MAKRKTTKTTAVPETEPDQPTTPDGGGGDVPRWQRMQTPEAPAQPEPEPTQAAQTEPDAEPEPKQPEPEPEQKTFTQAELEAQISDRLKRERKKYADYSDLKKKAEAFDRAERDKLEETERLKLELDEARQAAQAARTEAESQQISNAIFEAIAAYQGEKGVKFRRDAYGAALRLVNLEAVQLENGNVSGVDRAIADLAKDNSFLLEGPPQTQPGSPTNPARTNQRGTTDQERHATYFGGGKTRPFFQGDPDRNVVYPES